MMAQSEKEERTMTRYLLGAATEEECVEVEGRFLRDAEYLKRLRAIECEIVDDYVGGEISPADRRSLERRALASPQGREQIKRARRFRAQLDHIAEEEREPASLIAVRKESLWEKLGSRIFAPVFVLRYWAPVAALLLLLSGLWLLREINISRSRVAELTDAADLARRNEKELQLRLYEQRGERKLLTSRLENEKRQLAAERSHSIQAIREMRRIMEQSEPSATRESDFVELALTSGINRDSGDPRKLSIPMSVRKVKLQLELDPSVNYRSYRVELNTSGGAQVWAQGDLTAQRVEWGRFITLTLPTRALQAGEYELILSGLTDERKSEVAGYYYFIASPSDARRQ
jgi:hypothetical protein